MTCHGACATAVVLWVGAVNKNHTWETQKGKGEQGHVETREQGHVSAFFCVCVICFLVPYSPATPAGARLSHFAIGRARSAWLALREAAGYLVLLLLRRVQRQRL